VLPDKGKVEVNERNLTNFVVLATAEMADLGPLSQSQATITGI